MLTYIYKIFYNKNKILIINKILVNNKMFNYFKIYYICLFNIFYSIYYKINNKIFINLYTFVKIMEEFYPREEK